jgi:hypothetical protein
MIGESRLKSPGMLVDPPKSRQILISFRMAIKFINIRSGASRRRTPRSDPSATH